MKRCPVPVSCFCCFCISEIYFWKYSRNWTEICGEFLLDGRHLKTKGQPWGPPTGQGRPPAPPWPVCGTRPCSWWVPSAPSDAYKFIINLKTSRRPLFFQRSHPDAPSSQTLVRGDSEAVPGTLPEGRSIPEGSSSPCLPPG